MPGRGIPRFQSGIRPPRAGGDPAGSARRPEGSLSLHLLSAGGGIRKAFAAVSPVGFPPYHYI